MVAEGDEAMNGIKRCLGRWLIGLALAIALPLTSATAAWAGGGYGHRGHHGGGVRYGVHGGIHGDFWTGAAVVLGGLVILQLLQHAHENDHARRPSRAVAPSPPPGLGNCQPTTGRRTIGGRLALMRGTWCTDQTGRGYILRDSVRFVRYLN